jgi:hypothetical protein
MKKVFFVLLVSLSLFFSGCIIPNSLLPENQEQKAISLADKVQEIDLTLRMLSSLGNAKNCTADKFTESYLKVAEIQGIEASEPTEEELIQLQTAIDYTIEWVQECNPKLSKRSEKESETVYNVYYKFELTEGTDCGGSSTEELKVKVNLQSEETLMDESGSMDEETKKQFEAVLNYMGDCAGVMFFSAIAAVDYQV